MVVTVIDYGASNLLNVVRALEHCGAGVEVTQSPEKVAAAGKLVFPGVGAFGDCMDALNARGLVDPIRRYVAENRPFLGICVGMQVMFEAGYEFGEHKGLGIIGGRVARIPDRGSDGSAHKIPHIGWGELREAAPWGGTVLEPLAGDKPHSVYFVHSYHGTPTDPADLLATADYNGIAICAAVRRGNAYGCQFHPEKSGEAGLAVLKQYLAL
jgi:glutamine amidotransferase